MNQDLRSEFILRNQTMVRFQIGAADGVAYSNIVDTPWVGPILQLTKGASEQQQITLNQPVTFSLTVTNEGNRDAQMTLFDILPEGLAYIPNSIILNGAPLPGADPASGIQVGLVRSLSSIQVVFQAILVSIPASLDLINQATGTYSFQSLEGRTITGSITSNEVKLSVLPFYVSVVADISTNQTFAGDVITYMLTITNLGNVPLQNLVIYIPLPPGVTFVPGSVMIGDVYYPSIDPADGIPIGTLLPGATIVIRVQLRIGKVTGSNPFTVQGILSYSIDGVQYNEPANPLLVTVIQPEVTLHKTVDKNRAAPGCVLHYTSQIQNNGSFAVDASFKDTLPSELEFIPGSLMINGTPNHGTNPAEGFFLGTIRPGTMTEISFDTVVLVFKGSLPVRAINQASASFTFRLPDGRVVQQTVLSDPASVNLVTPDIHVNAVPTHYVVEPGEHLSFKLTIINRGSLAAQLKLIGWIQNKPVFAQGVVKINDMPVPYDLGFDLGVVDPAQQLTVTYTSYASADLHHTIEEVTGSFLFTFHSQVDECSYNGEARSDYITIVVDSGEE
ncbi:DUF11 domain-containing protein [Paenibacillus sp. HJL G12]|uniref:DUF11 domain-containing protein n=1 Tax=Paenibacillus dendrobii TaxID=2691084 RepID=A0A7X3LGE2_9BACL|nr:hypothetical protein [Paenibacillus dendrobii]MWV42413.1 DUF11 domain-containing protein [Paenibacillus dendrobii]